MSEYLFRFLDQVLQQYLGPEIASCPPMQRPDLERLLTDDGHRRLSRARAAATEWGHAEGNADVAVDCLLITPHGLIYAAALQGPATRRASLPVPMPRQSVEDQPATFYYVATTQALFEPVAERLAAAPPGQAVAAAVDSRYSHDLVFACPLDGALRRTLDAHEVLHLEP
jgi:hypothetical protein